MREIFPTHVDKANVASVVHITEQQYKDLVDRTNVAADKADAASVAVNKLRSDLSTGLNTTTLNATTASINQLSVDNETATEIHAHNIYADDGYIDDVHTERVLATRVDTDDLISVDSRTTNATAVNLNVTGTATLARAKIQNLEMDSFNPESINTGRIDATCLNVRGSIDVSGGVFGYHVESLGIGIFNDDVWARRDLTVTGTTTSNRVNSVYQDVNFITHKEKYQTITRIGDIWILLPTFTNGYYYIEAINDGGKKLWSVEVTNSVKNVQFRWSQYELGKILDFKTIEDAAGISNVQIHVKSDARIKLYYQSQSTDNELPPAEYTVDQMPSAAPLLNVTERAGTFISDVIFTNKLHTEELDMDSLLLKEGGFTDKLLLTCDYVEEGGVVKPVVTAGKEGDYVSNTVVEGQTVPHWDTPADRIQLNDTCLTPSCVIAEYDGTAYNKCDPDNCGYPITHLGPNTCVHGSAEVCCSLNVCCNITAGYGRSRLPSGFNIEGNLLNVCQNGMPADSRYNRGLWITDGCKGLYNQCTGYTDCIATYAFTGQFSDSPFNFDGCPMTWWNNEKAIGPTDDLHVSCVCTGKLTVSGDANISGDLYVAGTLHTVNEEELSTGSDTILLRQGNSTSLANGEFAGILVNKYNGTDTLAYGTDNTGQFRIGHVTGTSTTCNEICNLDGNWYVGTNKVNPAGELVSWTSKEYKTVNDKEYTVYKGAVFTSFNYTGLQPALTREETTALTDKALLKWSGTNKRAEDISMPTAACQILHWNGTDYQWKQDPVICSFASISAYNSANQNQIPVGSLVFIENETSYTMAEEIA